MNYYKSLNALALLLIALFVHQSVHAQSLILLSPAGDRQNRCRTIKNECERDVAHAFAYALGKEIQKKKKHTVALSHQKTDALESFQLVSLINRFNPNLVLKIFIHHETATKPSIALYYLMHNPLTDASLRPASKQAFIPFKRAHGSSFHTTRLYAQSLKRFLEKPAYTKKFLVRGPCGLPLTPLTGIICPALAIEIGLNSSDQWNQFVRPLAKAISELIQRENISTKQR
jgi:hypothetical protein